MYLQPISPLGAIYAPGDTIRYQALIDILPGNGAITLTLGTTVGYDVKIFDINTIDVKPDTTAYPPKPSVKLWDLINPSMPKSNTDDGLNTFQIAVGHTVQRVQPGNRYTTIPEGTYTIATFSFPILADAQSGTTNIILPTAFGKTGTIDSTDFVRSVDSGGVNNQVLAFPNDGISKFSSLTYTIGNTPSPSSLLVLAMGAVPMAGILRRRRNR